MGLLSTRPLLSKVHTHESLPSTIRRRYRVLLVLCGSRLVRVAPTASCVRTAVNVSDGHWVERTSSNTLSLVPSVYLGSSSSNPKGRSKVVTWIIAAIESSSSRDSLSHAAVHRVVGPPTARVGPLNSRMFHLKNERETQRPHPGDQGADQVHEEISTVPFFVYT